MASISIGSIKLSIDYKDIDGLKTKLGEIPAVEAKVREGMQGVNEEFKKAVSSVGDLKKEVHDLGKQIVAAFAVREVAQLTVDLVRQQAAWQGLTTAIKFGSGSAEEGAKNMAFLAATVKRMGLDLDSTAEGFKRFNAAARLSGLGADETRKIFGQVAQYASVMRLSVQSTESVFIALEQMLSKGTVQAQELKLQLGNALPAAFGLAAKAIGVTTMELNKMMEEGKIISTEFLPKFAALLAANSKDSAAEASQSLGANLNKLTTAFENLKLGIGAFLEGPASAFSLWFVDIAEKITYALNMWADPVSTQTEKFTKSLFDAEAKGGDAAEKLKEKLVGEAADLRVKLKSEMDGLDKVLENNKAIKFGLFGFQNPDSYKENIVKLGAEIAGIEKALAAFDKKNSERKPLVVAPDGKKDDFRLDEYFRLLSQARQEELKRNGKFREADLENALGAFQVQLTNQKATLQERAAQLELYNQRVFSINKEWDEKDAKAKEARRKKDKEAELVLAQQDYTDQKNFIDAQYADGAITDAQRKQALIDAEIQFQEEKLGILKFYGEQTVTEEQKIEELKNQQRINQKLLDEKALREKVKNEREVKALALGSLAATLGSFGNFLGALSSLAEKGSEEAKQLFVLSKAVAAGQIVISYLQEIAAINANAFATALPDFGLGSKASMVALANVRLGLSLATLAATTIGEAKGQGFKKGGYSGGTDANEIRGVVHGKEWIGPEHITYGNPMTSPLIEILEGARTGGSVGLREIEKLRKSPIGRLAFGLPRVKGEPETGGIMLTGQGWGGTTIVDNRELVSEMRSVRESIENINIQVNTTHITPKTIKRIAQRATQRPRW